MSVSFVENNLFPAGLLRAGAGAKGEAGELAWLSSDGFRLFTSIAMNKAWVVLPTARAEFADFFL